MPQSKKTATLGVRLPVAASDIVVFCPLHATPEGRAALHWAYTKILFHVFVCVQIINHPFLTPAHSHYPHYCNTVARLLRNV